MKKPRESAVLPVAHPQHAVLAFSQFSRTLRNASPAGDLTLERLTALGAVARREPASISELSAIEAVTTPTMSRTVAALQDRSLVRCVVNRSDGRSVLVISTAKGRATLEKGVTRALLQIAELLQKLSTEDLEAMAELIHHVRANRP